MSGKHRALVVVFAATVVMVGAAASSAAPKPQTISLLEVDNSFVGTGELPHNEQRAACGRSRIRLDRRLVQMGWHEEGFGVWEHPCRLHGHEREPDEYWRHDLDLV